MFCVLALAEQLFTQLKLKCHCVLVRTTVCSSKCILCGAGLSPKSVGREEAVLTSELSPLPSKLLCTSLASWGRVCLAKHLCDLAILTNAEFWVKSANFNYHNSHLMQCDGRNHQERWPWLESKQRPSQVQAQLSKHWTPATWRKDIVDSDNNFVKKIFLYLFNFSAVSGSRNS